MDAPVGCDPMVLYGMKRLQVNDELLDDEGVAKFNLPFDKLMETLEGRL